MKKILFRSILVGSLLAWFSCVQPVAAQDSRFERRFPNMKTEVDQALAEIQASAKGRLPILDGFVEENGEPLDHFDRGYYECSAKATSEADGGTTVRVVAKITAWYSGSTPAQSGYRVLPSNGRIETDLLDHLRELLKKKMPGAAPPAFAPAPRASHELPSAPMRAPIAETSSAPGIAPVIAPTVPTNRDLNSLRQRREEAEKNAKALNDDIQSFEEILRNQSHPDNLAVVRKSGTSIFAKQGGAVLLSADAEDEFEILGLEGSWVHVQISGVSRGWIQRAQVELPEGFAGSSKKESTSGTASDPVFRVTREETHSFTGKSQELQGKTVRIIWVAPVSESNQSSSAQAKRNFAKTLFARAYKEQSSVAQPPAGVVIVFDSSDGGQVSATISTLEQWQKGTLSETSFWKQCSIDPAELFQEVPNP
jgi:hypothetical protein